MRKRWFLAILVVLLTCFASFYICEARANTQTEETLPEEVNRPEWNIGDYWEYKVTYIMKSGKEKKGYTSLRKVLKKEMFEEIECYTSIENSLKGYYTLDLNMKGFINEIRGKVFNRAKITPDSMEYSWPLKVGKKWEQSYIMLVESRGRGGKGEPKENKITVNATYEVVGVEKVEVPAGEFLALKIVRRRVNDTVSEESWYSPRAKWFVRKVIYSQNDDPKSPKAELWELVKGEY